VRRLYLGDTSGKAPRASTVGAPVATLSRWEG